MSTRKITRRSFLLQSSLFSISGLVLGGSSVGVLKNPSQEEYQFIDRNTLDSFFSKAQLSILSELVDVLIPKTDTPSASDVEVHLILDEWMTGWAAQKTKEQFSVLIDYVDKEAQKRYRKNFITISEKDRFNLIEEIDKNSFDSQMKKTRERNAYRRFKSLVFHIYYTSKEANLDYVLVPGAYHGCIDEDELKRLIG